MRQKLPRLFAAPFAAGITATLASLLCAQSHAHHSTVEFDYTQAQVVVGVVKELQWTNPHSWLQVMVTDENGDTIEWGFELGAPVFNVRMGWRHDSLTQGDQVVVVFCPTKQLRPRGTLMHVYREGQETLNGIAANFFQGQREDDPLDHARPPSMVGVTE